MNRSRTATLAGSVVLGLASLAACGGDDSTTSSDTETTVEDVTTTTTATPEDTTPELTTVDANTATEDELKAAFEANGIPDAGKWAHEVEEYRPYPTDDPTFAKLRQELSKYGPSAEVLEKIVASLSL